MASEYQSIKDDVLKKLEANLPEIRERFGIETIGIFGSVSRGEDTDTSDIDILYTFQKGKSSFRNYAGVVDFLEELLGREIDFVSLECLNPNLKPYVEPDIILINNQVAIA